MGGGGIMAATQARMLGLRPRGRGMGLSEYRVTPLTRIAGARAGAAERMSRFCKPALGSRDRSALAPPGAPQPALNARCGLNEQPALAQEPPPLPFFPARPRWPRTLGARHQPAPSSRAYVKGKGGGTYDGGVGLHVRDVDSRPCARVARRWVQTNERVRHRPRQIRQHLPSGRPPYLPSNGARTLVAASAPRGCTRTGCSLETGCSLVARHGAAAAGPGRRESAPHPCWT